MYMYKLYVCKERVLIMVIAVANQKGGVAKTTCVHNLGVALSTKGKKVLLIDFDSQASLTISVGIEPLDIENNIVWALKKNSKPIAESVHKLKPNLDIVTSIIDLAQIEMEMMTRASREKILDRAMLTGDWLMPERECRIKTDNAVTRMEKNYYIVIMLLIKARMGEI